jgi:hypothetical protein
MRSMHDEAEALTDQLSVASFGRTLHHARVRGLQRGAAAIHAALP